MKTAARAALRKEVPMDALLNFLVQVLAGVFVALITRRWPKK